MHHLAPQDLKRGRRLIAMFTVTFSMLIVTTILMALLVDFTTKEENE